MVKVIGKGSQTKVEEILKYASIDRSEAFPAAKPKLQPGPIWGCDAEDSQLVRQEDSQKEPLREEDPAEFSFFKRVLDKKYSSPEQPTAVGSISSSTTAATAQSLSDQPPILPDLCFDEAEQQLISAAAKVTPLGLVKSQKTMASTSKPASSAKVHTNKRKKMPQDKSAKQVDQQRTKKWPAATMTVDEKDEASTQCYEECDDDVADDQEANIENEGGEEEEYENGGDDEDRYDDEECEPSSSSYILGLQNFSEDVQQ